MADDDEYVEGDSSSEPADAPGAIPADDTPREKAVGDTIDSVATHDAPVLTTKRTTARTVASRKAFAEAILANKKAEPKPVDDDIADPEAPPVETPKPAPVAAAPAAPVPTPAPVAPPAPSLDPEVRKIKEQLAAERAQLAKDREEWEKSKPAPEAPPDVLDYERYLDSQPRAFRSWLETMRGEKFASDDEFKSEMSDFITQASADVLGVPLPDNVRIKLDASQARKAVRESKVIQARKAAAAAAKAEAERKALEERTTAEQVEREWTAAADAVGQQFAPTQDATGAPVASQAAAAYPWLAAEDEPGKIVVDVIRAAMNKDGTQMSWQEASKKANDYLAEQNKRHYEKRKPLLGGAPAAPAPTAVAKPVVAAKPAPLPEARVVKAPTKWNRDKHLENTKAAFRATIAAAKPE